MDINELKKLVEDALKGADFSLNLESLSSPGVTYIAKHYLPGSTLTLTGAKILSQDAGSITIEGTGAEKPFNGMSVEAKFYILAGQAALTLKATGNSGYTLAKSFPEFEGTIGQAILFNSSPQPPVLFLLSDPESGLNTGLSFSGDIDFKSMTSGVSALLGIQSQSINGPIVLKTAAPTLFPSTWKGRRLRTLTSG